MKDIKIYDEVFTIERNMELYNDLLYHRGYKYGEVDSYSFSPSGLTLQFDEDSLFTVFQKEVFKKEPSLEDLELQRAYINLFLPNENPNYHDDGNVTTCIFYINPPYDLNENGETKFIIDDEIISVRAKPGRLVIFNGNIIHRATSFRNNPRITVVLKYSGLL
jgi:hypothetical protein